MDQAAIRATNIGATGGGWPAGGVLYWLHDDALSCAEADAIYNALSLAQKIAQSKTIEQLNALGIGLGAVRDCGVIVTPEDPTSYLKTLIVSNSIGFHPATPALGWFNNNGMAASAPEKDFAHIVEAYLKTLNSSAECRLWGTFDGTSVAEGGYYEANYWQLDGGLNRYNAIAAWAPDLIILRLSENIVDTSHDLLGNLGALIDKLKSNNADCKVVVTNSAWGQVDPSVILKQLATQRKYPFVDLFDMWGQPQYYAGQYADAGVAKHPNDAGHAEIAKRIIAKIPLSEPETPVDPPPIGDTNLAGLPSFETFNFPILTENQDSWTNFDGRTNRDGIIGEWVGLGNGQVNVKVYKRFGAAPAHISGPDGINRINIHDLGTMNGMTLYREGPTSPNPNAIISEEWFQIGNDPIQHGTVFGDPSPVLYMARNSSMIYTVSMMNNWPVKGETTDVKLEQWVVLQGRGVHVYTRMTFNRAYDKTFYGFRAQEFPTFFSDSKYRTLGFVNAAGNVQFIANQAGQFDVPVTKPWVALAESNNVGAQAIGLGAPGLYMSSQWQKSLDEGTGELSNAAGYSQWRAFMHFDWNQQAYSHHYWVVGTVSEIQAYCEAAPDPRNRMVWKFNTRWGRGHNCWKNGVDEGFPTHDDGIEVTKQGNSEFYLKLPYMAIHANTVSQFCIRYKETGFSSPWRLVITRSGQGESEVFVKEFSTISDNQWHTVTIALDGAWSGVVQQIKLSNDAASAGSKIKIAWYNTVDADPEP